MATPMHLLGQLRALSTEDLRRDVALRLPTVALRLPTVALRETSEPGRATAGDTLRDVITELRDELDQLVEWLGEWETADDREAAIEAREGAAGSAGNVLHELARLGAVAPSVEDPAATVDRVTARVRMHPALADRTREQARQLVAAVLSTIGHVPALPTLTEPLPAVPAAR